MRIFIIFLCLFSAFSSAQLIPQTQPTQPSVLIINTKPQPNFSTCSASSFSCVDDDATLLNIQQIIIDYCGYETEYFVLANNSLFPCSAGVPPADPPEVTPQLPINCMTCSCPSGQIRADGICVIDQSCSFGVQDFVTGSCFSPACPFGDGTPENCGLAPTCVQSEVSILIPASFGVLASCVCPFGTAWNDEIKQCATPLCNGFNNSPIGSFFDLATNQCECSATAIINVATNSCVETLCQNVGEIYSSGAGQCVVGLQCPHGYDLNTATNTCYKVTNDLQQCSVINHQVLLAYSESINNYNASGINVCYMRSSSNVEYELWQSYFNYPGGFTASPYGSLCAATDGDINTAFHYERFARDYCLACDTNANYIDLQNEFPIGQPTRVTFYNNGLSCMTPQLFCSRRLGLWNVDLNTCMNGNLQSPPAFISSSSQSSSQQSSFNYSQNNSSTSSDSASTSGGASGSSGSAPAGGGGGGDGGGGDGGGGDGGSGGGGATGSSASQNSIASVPSSTQTSVANTSQQNSSSPQVVIIVPPTSANNSVANMSISGGGTSQANISSYVSGGSAPGGGGTGGGDGGTTGGGGGGGGGGSNTSSGTITSSGNTSSVSNGPCDPNAANYLDCIGKNKKQFPAHTVTKSGATTSEEVNANFLTRLNSSPTVASFNKFKTLIIVPDSACPDFSIDLTDTIINSEISTTIHCDLMINISAILSLITMIGWSFIAFKIFASA